MQKGKGKDYKYGSIYGCEGRDTCLSASCGFLSLPAPCDCEYRILQLPRGEDVLDALNEPGIPGCDDYGECLPWRLVWALGYLRFFGWSYSELLHIALNHCSLRQLPRWTPSRIEREIDSLWRYWRRREKHGNQ